MGLFSRRSVPAVIQSPKPPELYSAAELNPVLAAAQIRSTPTIQQVFEQLGDEGGHFSMEHDVRVNAGRLKTLYLREPWIYTAATRIAWALSSVPLKVYAAGSDKELPKHPLNALLRSGSMIQSPTERRISTSIDLTLAGNSFLVLEEDLKTVAGIAPVESCDPIYDARTGELLGVKGTGASGKTIWVPVEQLVWSRYPNPLNPAYGLSPIAAAAQTILLDRHRREFEMAFYVRGATASGVVETTEDIPTGRFKRLLLTFEQTFTGRSNWWRQIFLPKGATWKSTGLSMVDAQHLENLRENRKALLAVLGVPPSIVGIIEDVNRATAEQQERVFWANTVVPLSKLEADGWNASYLVSEKLKGSVEVRPDFSGLEAVEGFVSMKTERAKAMEPYFLVDEIREKVWKADPLPDGRGDVFVAEIAKAQPAALPGADLPEAAPAGDVGGDAVTAPTISLNGAQVASLLEIVARVAAGLIPRETGVELIMAAFALDRDTAERIMGEVGRSFFIQIDPDGAAEDVDAEDEPGAPPKGKAVEVPAGFDIQTLIFAKDQFSTAEAAQAWAKEHGFRSDKVDETSDSWRIRQNPPDAYDPDSLRTIVLTQGVSAVVGKRIAPVEPGKSATFLHAKAVATSAQNRVEAKLGKQLSSVLDGYLDDLLAAAAAAIRTGKDVGPALALHADERRTAYLARAMPIYEAGMERGFSFALSQVKAAPRRGQKAKVSPAFPGVTETDRQAADALRDKQRDGRRRILKSRADERFAGFDRTRSDAIQDLVEAGAREGLTFEQIAANLRASYDEAYRNQMRTVVRTEILSAVSEGLAWNHDVLSQVFTKTAKQWIHQGDEGINKDAREEHVALEEAGEIPGFAVWTYTDEAGETVTLAYPRDPRAPAGAVINCRCSQVTVIPDDAESRADQILEET